MAKNKQNLYLHADGDSFFVACELSLKPALRGKPVIVGGDRGIAVAMSPEAKKIGVHRGMPVFQIKKLFPEIIILPHHFELYRDISERMLHLLTSYFSKVEQYSIDECFAEVDPSEIKYYGGEKKLLASLKKDIESTLGVTYSLGLARTKALAKLASKLEKPNGVVFLSSKEEEIKALKNTPIDNIWGIGRRTIPHLRELHLETAYDFVDSSDKIIEKKFSRPVLALKKELSGEPILEVKSDVDPRSQKSLQATSTFHPASTSPAVIFREISENAEHACREARKIGLVSKNIAIFVKDSDFKYYFTDLKLSEYSADPGNILDALEPKFLKLLPKKKRIRSTGVILHELVRQEKVPHDLFGRQEKALKITAIEETADKIRKKFGSGSIKRAASMKRKF